MPKKVVLYRASDGSLHESPEEADAHDLTSDLDKSAKRFIEHHYPDQRNISKVKATALLASFAYEVIINGQVWPHPEDQDDTPE